MENVFVFMDFCVNWLPGYGYDCHYSSGVTSVTKPEHFSLMSHIKQKSSGPQNQNALVVDERYYSFLRQLFRKIPKTKSNIVHREALMPAVKAIKELLGTHGLVWNLLIFGATLKLPVILFKLSELFSRIFAMNSVLQRYADQRTSKIHWTVAEYTMDTLHATPCPTFCPNWPPARTPDVAKCTSHLSSNSTDAREKLNQRKHTTPPHKNSITSLAI